MRFGPALLLTLVLASPAYADYQPPVHTPYVSPYASAPVTPVAKPATVANPAVAAGTAQGVAPGFATTAADGVPSAMVRNEAPFNGPSALLGKVSCATKVKSCHTTNSTQAVQESNECVQWNYSMSSIMNDYKFSGPLSNCVLPSSAEKIQSVGNYRWPVCCYQERSDQSCGLTCYMFVSR